MKNFMIIFLLVDTIFLFVCLHKYCKKYPSRKHDFFDFEYYDPYFQVKFILVLGIIAGFLALFMAFTTDL